MKCFINQLKEHISNKLFIFFILKWKWNYEKIRRETNLISPSAKTILHPTGKRTHTHCLSLQFLSLNVLIVYLLKLGLDQFSLSIKKLGLGLDSLPIPYFHYIFLELRVRIAQVLNRQPITRPDIFVKNTNLRFI